jgi:hypothetical protein
MMKKIFAIVLLSLPIYTLSSTVLAAPAKNANNAAASTDTASETQTDVIGSKEAPSVFNIVPWKDKAVAIPKKEVNTSILRETLQPLDKDMLNREIQLQQSLSTE